MVAQAHYMLLEYTDINEPIPYDPSQVSPAEIAAAIEAGGDTVDEVTE